MSIGFQNRSVNPSNFAMVQRPDVPRSVFHVESAHKTTFDGGWLVPIYVDEVLPGDSHNVDMTAFARMSTPIFPIMDNLFLSSFFFFVPARLLWDNWEKFMGDRDPNPNSSIDYLVPQVNITGPAVVCSLMDYFGIPTGTPVFGAWTFNALIPRAYNLIWNEWFRDENLQNSVSVPTTDGPDSLGLYNLLRRGKRKDYFTSALPWPQKGTPATIPITGSAPVRTSNAAQVTGAAPALSFSDSVNGAFPLVGSSLVFGLSGVVNPANTADTPINNPLYPNNLYADLSQATAVTINALRQAFQIQKLLERDARGGTRYTEIIRAHFGVISPDARLQRPEYLGGGRTPVNINPVAQTTPTSGANPMGGLAGVGTVVARHGFSKSFTEHGYIIGLANIQADLTYQQGTHRMWSRRTRYDFYWPSFAHLGEQAILRKEIYTTGLDVDNEVFGYQERYAEYRYKPSMITGKFRSLIAGTLDTWHLAQAFGSNPTLSDTFIQDTPPISRVVAAGDLANNQQFLFDSVFIARKIRPIPMFGTPGFVDRF